MAEPECPNRIDEDDPESPPCGDEGRVCGPCGEKEAAYWHSYFGLKHGNTPEVKAHNRRQLDAFRPPGVPPLDGEDEYP